MPPEPDPLLDSQSELAFWPAIGHHARAGSWSRQAQTSLQRIEMALAEGRREAAAELVRHLVVEATEIHELLSEWCVAIPAILRRAGVAPERIIELDKDARAGAGGVDHEACWRRFVVTAGESGDAILAGTGGDEVVQATVATWLEGHDSHLLVTAAWVDAVVTELGEDKLGELWAELHSSRSIPTSATTSNDLPGPTASRCLCRSRWKGCTRISAVRRVVARSS